MSDYINTEISPGIVIKIGPPKYDLNRKLFKVKLLTAKPKISGSKTLVAKK